MLELSQDRMKSLAGGETLGTLCGVTVGATIGATFLFGGVGFALTVNKALAACTLALLA